MLEKFEKYCESEYTSVKNYLERNHLTFEDTRRAIYSAMSRLLGVADFIQQLDPTLNFDDIDIIYTSYRKALDNLQS